MQHASERVYPGSKEEMMPTKLELAGWLDERRERFIAIADAIWAKPEVALRETAACALQAETLAADGFAITRDVGGLPTAFMAEWGSGHPVLGFLGEYDALPGLSQESQATQAPIVATGAMGIGHKGMLYAAQALAVTAAELVSDPAHLGRARAEFQKRSGGQPYRSPLPANATPPLPASGR
jgi:aminobenzoyl-glutamate utilization protein B